MKKFRFHFFTALLIAVNLIAGCGKEKSNNNLPLLAAGSGSGFTYEESPGGALNPAIIMKISLGNLVQSMVFAEIGTAEGQADDQNIDLSDAEPPAAPGYDMPSMSIAYSLSVPARRADLPEPPSEFADLDWTKGWLGPDVNGWYVKFIRYENGYEYKWEIRYDDDNEPATLPDPPFSEYKFSIIYDHADAQYSYVVHVKTTLNDNDTADVTTDDTLDGFVELIEDRSGYSVISNTRWRMEYTDWSATTGAGVFDWYWEAYSLGGSFDVPYHRYMNITADMPAHDTEACPDCTLHKVVTWYDYGGIEVSTFEYDSVGPADYFDDMINTYL